MHRLEPDPALPYQVFARDSSVMTPNGAVIAQLHQSWRRGEYAAAIRFYERSEIPIRGMVTAGALEGGDVMVLEPGCAVIGAGEARTEEPAARQLAGWLADEGWEVRVEPIPERYVHIDVLIAVLAERLLAVCSEALSGGIVSWLRGRGFELIEVSAEDAFQLGANAISLGDERVLSVASASALNAAMRAQRPDRSRARPLDVHPRRRRGPLPGPGASQGAACSVSEPGNRRRPGDRRPPRARPADRRPRRGSAPVLGRGVARGSRVSRRAPRRDRTWRASSMRRGTCGPSSADRGEPALAVGSHLDSVPAGGWLDGALGVMAGVGVLRAWAAERTAAAPPRRWSTGQTRRERASAAACSAARRSLEPSIPPRSTAFATRRVSRSSRCWPRTTSTSSGRRRQQARQGTLAAYLELHIEQGPVLEAEGLSAAAVERLRRRGAAPVSVHGAGLTRRDDTDGPPPGRGPGRRRDRASGRGDRQAPRRRRDHRRAHPPAPASRRRSPARQSSSSTCATPRRTSSRRCSRRLERRRRRSPDGVAARSRSSRSGGSSRFRSTPISSPPPETPARRSQGPTEC